MVLSLIIWNLETQLYTIDFKSLVWCVNFAYNSIISQLGILWIISTLNNFESFKFALQMLISNNFGRMCQPQYIKSLYKLYHVVTNFLFSCISFEEDQIVFILCANYQVWLLNVYSVCSITRSGFLFTPLPFSRAFRFLRFWYNKQYLEINITSVGLLCKA